jgi:hypothetical protein
VLSFEDYVSSLVAPERAESREMRDALLELKRVEQEYGRSDLSRWAEDYVLFSDHVMDPYSAVAAVRAVHEEYGDFYPLVSRPRRLESVRGAVEDRKAMHSAMLSIEPGARLTHAQAKAMSAAVTRVVIEAERSGEDSLMLAAAAAARVLERSLESASISERDCFVERGVFLGR